MGLMGRMGPIGHGVESISWTAFEFFLYGEFRTYPEEIIGLSLGFNP
jgi:hypothetical protein